MISCSIAERNSPNASKRVLRIFYHNIYRLERIYALFYTADTVLFFGTLVAFITSPGLCSCLMNSLIPRIVCWLLSIFKQSTE